MHGPYQRLSGSRPCLQLENKIATWNCLFIKYVSRVSRMRLNSYKKFSTFFPNENIKFSYYLVHLFIIWSDQKLKRHVRKRSNSMFPICGFIVCFNAFIMPIISNLMQWKAYFDKTVKKDFFIKKNAVKSLNQFSGVTIWKMKKKVFLSWDV